MSSINGDRIVEMLARVQTEVWIIWSGMAAVTLALLVLMCTRFGRSRPLRKCVVLSIFAHFLLLAYAATIKIVGAPGPGGGGEPAAMRVVSVKTLEEPKDATVPASPKPWQATPLVPAALPEVAQPPRRQDALRPAPQRETKQVAFAASSSGIAQSQPMEPTPPPTSSHDSPAHSQAPAEIGDQAPGPQPSKQQPVQVAPDASQSLNREQPSAQRPEASRTRTEAASSLLDRAPERKQPAETTSAEPARQMPDEEGAPRSAGQPATPEATGGADAADGSTEPGPPASEGRLRPIRPASDLAPRISEHRPQPPSDPSLTVQSAIEKAQRHHAVPQTYQLRGRPDRANVLQAKGGSPDTEAAVRAALAWLAAKQEPGGRWDAAKHGAGWERRLVPNENGVGFRVEDVQGSMHPDTGVTGLALLAFLGAGHTHEDGEYRDTVRRGLQYLLKTQAEDGKIAGEATEPAAMYCHGMATLAIAEAYGMTGDKQLREPLGRAIAYILAAQNPNHGGWRYRPQDRWGDTSQLGWQLMALKAAELAGLESIPVACRHGMLRFLDSVSSGQHGGLASYRVGEGASHVMTAEALYCRLLLGTAPDNLSCGEAADMIVANLPGEGASANFYYWYYATLATYQLQGAYWETWNRAVQKELLSLQRWDGSWNPDAVWGGYGGRVFSTALGALCLEVYYRYLPTATAARTTVRKTR